MKRLLVAAVIAVHLVLADAIVKELAVHYLKGQEPVVLVSGLFDLAYVENRGCAWGMFQGHVWPLAVFGVAALAFLVWKRRAIFGSGEPLAASRLGAVAEPLLYAGIVGNAVDRLFRGFVVDMFDVHWGSSHFPCFNLADSFITASVALLLLASLMERQQHGRRPS